MNTVSVGHMSAGMGKSNSNSSLCSTQAHRCMWDGQGLGMSVSVSLFWQTADLKGKRTALNPSSCARYATVAKSLVVVVLFT